MDPKAGVATRYRVVDQVDNVGINDISGNVVLEAILSRIHQSRRNASGEHPFEIPFFFAISQGYVEFSHCCQNKLANQKWEYDILVTIGKMRKRFLREGPRTYGH
jgi:hypothetical protein